MLKRMKVATTLSLCVALIISASLTASAREHTALEAQPRSAEEVKSEIQAESKKHLQYLLDEYTKAGTVEKRKQLAALGVVEAESKTIISSTKELDIVEAYYEDLVDQAYIYTMDDHGYVYDRNGEVVNKIDDEVSTERVSALSISPASLSSSIHGYDSGAFVRQQTTKGFKGIRSTFTLPAPSNMNVVPNNNASGNPSTVSYIYSGMDVITVNGTTVSIPSQIEAGFQYSSSLQDYAAYVKLNGSSQSSIPEGATVAPPRYKNNTSVISNVFYDTVSSQYKYFVTGTNINNVNQHIYFYRSVALTAQNIQDLTVKRVTAIAKANWDGSLDLGNIRVSYATAELTRVNNTTTNLTSSLLSTHTYNGKIYGTSDNYNTATGTVTKSPATGNIYAQTVYLDSK